MTSRRFALRSARPDSGQELMEISIRRGAYWRIEFEANAFCTT
jgi:hypothetical protein